VAGLLYVILEIIHNKTQESVVPLDPGAVAQAGEVGASPARTNGFIDTTMEVSLLNAGLAGERDRSAPLAAFLEVRVRLVRQRDGLNCMRIPGSRSAVRPLSSSGRRMTPKSCATGFLR